MLEYFSRAITENDSLREELGYTWYLIKSIDVDGTKLNESWFKGPITLTNYARGYFRPAGYEQAEWTFPMEHKKYKWDAPIPETQTLMRMIDEVKPDFMYSLHNSGFGGTYWYLTKDMPEVWDKLYAASRRQELPLHLGEPEVNYITPYAPAIFPMISQAESYDYFEKYSKLPPEQMITCGESSGHYAGKYGTVTLVTELPYFSENRIQSDKPMAFTRKDAALKKLEAYHQNASEIAALYGPIQPLISRDNPFAKMVAVSLKNNDDDYEAEKAFIEGCKEYAEICKEAEAFDNLELPKFFRLFLWTLLIRSCEHELAKNPDEQARALLLNTHAAGEEKFRQYAAEAERDIHYEVTPIRKLVSVQLESGMLVSQQVRKLREQCHE